MKKDVENIWIDLNEELYKFIYSKVKDKEVTKDILQEVFIKIQLKIGQLQQVQKLIPWIYQITRNTIIDYFRSLKIKNISVDDIDIPQEQSEDIAYTKLSTCINQKIDLLSSKHKEAIVLVTFKEYSQKELAKHLKISYSGTKSRVQKARDILKENIINCPNVETDIQGKLIDFDSNNS
ncbi:RNA polymerase subunit sigma [Aquimarina aggregata]|uniref:RNA polymerase subunit sigma n=1 Tax=Aquimarina aggregata TaxID=1642818 RepID=A0A163CUN4_9FLAO|nr:sigma-70 family RNA polymerase sigma factor [Aquimarina aggregata]KZS42773.1 RNA polymerase subunit sigma [Aquimarina aggregata]